MNNPCCPQDDSGRLEPLARDNGQRSNAPSNPSTSSRLNALSHAFGNLFVVGSAALAVALVAALSGVVGPFSGSHALDAAWTSQPPLAEQAQRSVPAPAQSIVPVSASHSAMDEE